MNYFSAFTPSPLYSHKENYLRYLDSRQWQEVKRSYWLSNRPNECWACGKKYDYKSQSFNFHHLTYKNLYRERPEDLMLLCANHHRELELSWKSRTMSSISLEAFSYAFVCASRIEQGKSFKPLMKYFKGLID